MVGRFAGGSDQAVADTLQGRRQQGSVTKGDDPVPTGFRLADTPSGRMTACNLSVRAVVAGFAVLAALALAATLPNAAFGADSTLETSSTAGAEAVPAGNVADGPGNAPNAPGLTADGPKSEDAAGGPGYTADAPGDAADGPGSAADRPGNAADTPGHGADGPGNSENAGHAADGPGNSANAPGRADDAPGGGANVDRGTSVSQEADASASAEQRDVDNTSIAVHVDEPGDGTPVGQENRATADAAASTSAAVENAGEASVQQNAQADASAAQSGVSNTSIVMRVGSPGDDPGVSQANLATSNASASAALGSGDAAYGAQGATATVTQEGITNTAVSVRVFSPGEDGPVDQINAVSASTSTGGADGTEYAAAQQDGVQNTSVSIRVESPGASGTVTQQNAAAVAVTAGSTNGVAVAVTGDAQNTTLSVAVGGSDLDRPGPAGLQVWIWNWAWQRDESDSLDGIAGAAMTSWNWDWDGGNTAVPGGTITSRAANEGDNERVGTWEWSWDWTRTGVAGWAWGWNVQGSLPCSSCVWIWNWTWSWTGQPGDDISATTPWASAVNDASPPGQLNVAQAEADAVATTQVAQTVRQEGMGGPQFAGQLTDVVQIADAVANAQQADVGSIAWDLDQPGQFNIVRSDAAALLDGTVGQDAEQLLAARDAGSAEQWSGQQVDLAQVGGAEASTSQHDALLTSHGAHHAHGAATAAGSADVAQQVNQGGLVDGGTSSQSAGQLTLVEQVVDAAARVDQSGTPHSRRAGGTAGASTSATDLIIVEQVAAQTSARDAGTGVQLVSQLVYAAQDASAYATTTQQAGSSALPLARSEADALNRAAVVQTAAQSSIGSLGFDLQEVAQESIAVQLAMASSTSSGGIAGSAAVVNCAIVEQGATQSLGAGSALVGGNDLNGFCSPPSAAPGSSPETPSPTWDVLMTLASTVTPAGVVTQPTRIDDEPGLFYGGRRAGASRTPTTTHQVPGLAALQGQRPTRPGVGSPQFTKFSALHSTQARLDTRPGSHAGTGDAGREPPLPPVGDPPTWVSALAAAVSGAGPSGIAAILLAFVLVPPLLLRAREGSVVRRPTDVLAPIDVPV